MTEPKTAENEGREVAPMTAFNTAALATGCLYHVTGSVDVTVIGTAISAVMAAWAMWLRNRAVTASSAGQPSIGHGLGKPGSTR